MEKEKDGVWRTIRGRRIFIASGQSLGEAMAKSGKFKKLTRENIREAREEISTDDRMNRADQHSHEAKMAYDNKEKADHLNRKADKDWNKIREQNLRFTNSVYGTDKQAPKNRINENEPQRVGDTRVDKNYFRYSEADRRELRHEKIQKKLADYNYAKANEDLEKNSKEWENRFNQGYNKYDDLDKERKDARNRFETARIKGNIDTQEKSDKIIADFKAKKQSNNKLENNTIDRNTAIDYANQLNQAGYYNSDDTAINKEIKDKYGISTTTMLDIGRLEDLHKMNKLDDAIIKNSLANNPELQKAIDKGIYKPSFNIDKQSNNKIEKSKNNYDSKTLEQAKAELGWGHHNLTNEKAVEEKFGKQSNNKATEQKLGYNDARQLLNDLNNEGSDFTFGEIEVDKYNKDFKEDGNIKTEVSVFMPDDRGYVSRELNIPVDKNETRASLEEKLRDWQERHNSPDSFYDDDFEDKAKKQETIKNYVEKKKSNNAQTTNRILERSGKVNQKTLKSYAKDGLATDISNYSDKELDKLEKKHGKIRALKTTNGVYGMNGGLFRGEKSGEYFVITSRSGNLYRLV